MTGSMGCDNCDAASAFTGRPNKIAIPSLNAAPRADANDKASPNGAPVVDANNGASPNGDPKTDASNGTSPNGSPTASMNYKASPNAAPTANASNGTSPNAASTADANNGTSPNGATIVDMKNRASQTIPTMAATRMFRNMNFHMDVSRMAACNFMAMPAETPKATRSAVAEGRPKKVANRVVVYSMGGKSKEKHGKSWLCTGFTDQGLAIVVPRFTVR